MDSQPAVTAGRRRTSRQKQPVEIQLTKKTPETITIPDTSDDGPPSSGAARSGPVTTTTPGRFTRSSLGKGKVCVSEVSIKERMLRLDSRRPFEMSQTTTTMRTTTTRSLHTTSHLMKKPLLKMETTSIVILSSVSLQTLRRTLNLIFPHAPGRLSRSASVNSGSSCTSTSPIALSEAAGRRPRTISVVRMRRCSATLRTILLTHGSFRATWHSTPTIMLWNDHVGERWAFQSIDQSACLMEGLQVAEEVECRRR